MTHPFSAEKTPRCTTGIKGLDDILGGGFPRNRIYLVQGSPGVGKTTLALQFLLEGARLGEPALYITLSETREELESVADSHGWDLNRIELFELSAMQEALEGETENTFYHPSEIELNRTTEALLARIESASPLRIVFDSLSEMRMLAETPLRYRRQILRLKQHFSGRKCTVLLLDDLSAAAGDPQIESIAHGVIDLQRLSPAYGVSRRQINIRKIRGVKFREGFHDLILETGGMVIFPRLVAAEHHAAFEPGSFASGIAELDQLLGGGLDRGTSNMFMGPPGTGKSTLTIKFALAAALRGEKTFLISFDETMTTLINRAAKLGMDIQPHIDSGLIRVEQVDPAEISPGELIDRIRHAVIRDGARIVVLDSINGYLNAMPEERFLNLQLHELLAYLNQQGVITIMVLAQQGLIGQMQSSVDLTYLADTVVLLRYFEARGAIRQAISVIKKRSGNHERTIRELWMSKEKGFELGEPLRDMQGVLSGIPTFHRDEVGKNPLIGHD
ncbi:MAG: ATPase domain-containing protein, partial [Chthoniobacterales bacterium]